MSTITIHPSVETTRALLEGLGWTLEAVPCGCASVYRSTDQAGRCYWQLDEALTVALRDAAAALTVGHSLTLELAAPVAP